LAILSGNESPGISKNYQDDIHPFFGLGCRNITKIFVPKGYDFVPLLIHSINMHPSGIHHKYANNYDYQLSILLLNKCII
jgi:hypothetical protein